jgi:2-dehydro-3-deoxyglucarate aldolase/4-hydroxy-2-oxoheptanedioate aldolase
VRKNLVKERLRAGECVYGTSLEECLDPEMPALLRASGLDFFFVDTEHSAADYAQIRALCRVAISEKIVPLVRVPQNEPALITRALDMGVMGVIVPRVHSRTEAEAALDVMRFPPLGHRGFGLHGIITDFGSDLAQTQIESANDETMAVLMIESGRGLDSVEEIAKVPGLDVLFIGPYDLTLSLGIIEQFDNPIFLGAVKRVVAACNSAGIAAGMQSGNMELLMKGRDMGVRFMMYSSDTGVLQRGYTEAVAMMKKHNSDK